VIVFVFDGSNLFIKELLLESTICSLAAVDRRRVVVKIQPNLLQCSKLWAVVIGDAVRLPQVGNNL
jgi:hypothetical protein